MFVNLFGLSIVVIISLGITRVGAQQTNTCSANEITCDFGDCYSLDRLCDGKVDCEDGRDEIGCPSDKCVLPAYPNNGRYVVTGAQNASSGDVLQEFQLHVTCNSGYIVNRAPKLSCSRGIWSTGRIPTCELCGRVVPIRTKRVLRGREARRGELPWYAAIYAKTTTPYSLVCAGNLVSSTVVITSAYCFWDFTNLKINKAPDYAVALGKLYRDWDSLMDTGAQKSDISDIKIPDGFKDEKSRSHYDLAVVLLKSAVEYNAFIQPVCLDFDLAFDRKHIQSKVLGKVGGWGATDFELKNVSPVLKVIGAQYLTLLGCVQETPPGFRENFTGENLCIGFRNGLALCKGDRGAGLVFPDWERGFEQYYLRGVVETWPSFEEHCNPARVTDFVHITLHADFIKQFL